jgi:hypothetical protein
MGSKTETVIACAYAVIHKIGSAILAKHAPAVRADALQDIISNTLARAPEFIGRINTQVDAALPE